MGAKSVEGEKRVNLLGGTLNVDHQFDWRWVSPPAPCAPVNEEIAYNCLFYFKM